MDGGGVCLSNTAPMWIKEVSQGVSVVALEERLHFGTLQPRSDSSSWPADFSRVW